MNGCAGVTYVNNLSIVQNRSTTLINYIVIMYKSSLSLPKNNFDPYYLFCSVNYKNVKNNFINFPSFRHIRFFFSFFFSFTVSDVTVLFAHAIPDNQKITLWRLYIKTPTSQASCVHTSALFDREQPKAWQVNNFFQTQLSKIMFSLP